MNTNSTTTDKSDNRILALTAFILFLLGFFLPLLVLFTILFFRPFLAAASLLLIALNFLACGAELLALVFGLMTWRLKLGKVATIGAVLFWILFVVNLFRFYHGR